MAFELLIHAPEETSVRTSLIGLMMILVWSHFSSAVTREVKTFSERIRALSCDEPLAPGVPDHTRVVPKATLKGAWSLVKRTVTERSLYPLEKALERGADRSWATAARIRWQAKRDSEVAVWDKQYQEACIGDGWVCEYVAQRQELDFRARRLLERRVRNEEEAARIFDQARGLLLELHEASARRAVEMKVDRQRVEREFRYRVNTAFGLQDLLRFLRAVSPPGAPEPTPPLIEALAKNLRLRRVIAREVQWLRWLARTRLPLERIRALQTARLENTFALLARTYDAATEDFDPSLVTEIRAAQIRLNRGLADHVGQPLASLDPFRREAIVAEAAARPELARIIIAAGRELPDEIEAPRPPTPPDPEPEPPTPRARRLMTPKARREFERARALEAERNRERERDASARYVAEVRAYNAGAGYREAQENLVLAHKRRANARWAYVTYLAYAHPDVFADPRRLATLKGRVTRAVNQREAGPERNLVPTMSQVGLAVNQRVPQPMDDDDPTVRWLTAAFYLCPELIAAEDPTPLEIPVHPPLREPPVRTVEPIQIPRTGGEGPGARAAALADRIHL